MYRHLLITIVIFVIGCCQTVFASDYPAQCRVTAQTLNVRSGPDKGYSKMGTLRRGDVVQVDFVTSNVSEQWGRLEYRNGRQGYVSMRYMSYVAPVQQEVPKTSTVYSSSDRGWFSGLFESIASLFSGLWSIIKWGLIILMIVVALAFWQDIVAFLIFMGICSGIGSIVFGMLFNNSELGGLVGAGFAAFVGLKRILESINEDYANTMWLIYWIVSFPVYLLNKTQYVLSEPWRYIFRTSWVGDGVKTWLRPALEVLKVVLYIVLTPLRVVNAIIYNIFIYAMTSIYSLFFEVLRPTAKEEGAGNLWTWIYMFAFRLLKYPVWHGGIALVEGFIWTVVDTVIPAITLYHGTDLTAAEAILRSTDRNTYLRNTSTYTSGTFSASKSSWGGIGVYFAARRSVARSYARDPYRLSDRNPMMIVCRVSLGRVINYALAPHYVYMQAGEHGRHSELNKYGENNGYTTGEWWNGRGGYWEYCLFDWQNRYNHPWRIRPIYAFNLRTNQAQPIKGGMQHWLFEKEILDDLFS